MRSHWTKTKGDVGVLHAQIDLAERGYGILWPLSEHEPFDLVAYRGRDFCRIQVRYRAAVRGRIQVRFRSSWADKHGSHTLAMEKEDVDVVCVFCPDTRRCYYIDPRKFSLGVTLRLAPARNNQTKGVLPAEDFTNFRWPLSSMDRAGRF